MRRKEENRSTASLNLCPASTCDLEGCEAPEADGHEDQHCLPSWVACHLAQSAVDTLRLAGIASGSSDDDTNADETEDQASSHVANPASDQDELALAASQALDAHNLHELGSPGFLQLHDGNDNDDGSDEPQQAATTSALHQLASPGLLHRAAAGARAAGSIAGKHACSIGRQSEMDQCLEEIFDAEEDGLPALLLVGPSNGHGQEPEAIADEAHHDQD
mmetsp:Transcript_81057/g.177995  ORF Transcript_81057/g.177995 Transcript_81057/m.177995 type:complete len:219 (-) Transcript_81057:303-959(-)